MRFVVIGLVLAAAIAAAQSSRTNWANVRSLTVGEEIRVSMTDGKSYQGQLRSSTDDSLIMVAASSQETLARPQVQKIATKHSGHRGRNTLIGLGIGAGGGLAIGAGSDHSCAHNGCFLGNNIGKEVLTPVGAVVGAIVGVAWPTGRWHDVYRSK